MRSPLEFRDPPRASALYERLGRSQARVQRPVRVMHVCGSHEQAIARFALRERLPAGLEVRMGPGCPVCVTDTPEIDGAVALARAGLPVLTYGDMLRVPGSTTSLADARAEGARVEVVTSPLDVRAYARRIGEPVVFLATGFETTAVTTAALLLDDPPANLFVLSAHKWVPAAMEVVAGAPGNGIDGYLAAGHAATITGFGLFEPFAARHGRPVVVAGFEPLDILVGLCRLVEQLADGRAEVDNVFPRCVTRGGNRRALGMLWEVFILGDGDWRGIATVPGGELRLGPRFAAWDARERFAAHLDVPSARSLVDCECGAIMLGRKRPEDCAAFGTRCTPARPLGACMVSTEGPCRNSYGAMP